MTEKKYLEGVPNAPRRFARVVFLGGLYWLAFMAVGLIVPLAFQAAGPLFTFVVLTAPVWLLVAILLLWFAQLTRGWAELRKAEATLLRGDLDLAERQTKRALSRGLGQAAWWQGLLLLGRVAEGRGDFSAAAEIFERSTRAYRLVDRSAVRQTAPLSAAYRAFALSASDRLDEADAALRQTEDELATPLTRPMAVRAKALLLSKRKAWRELVDLLAAERGVIRRGLSRRDRLLLSVLGSEAKRALEDRHRVAGVEPLDIEAEEREWLEAVEPSLKAMRSAG